MSLPYPLSLTVSVAARICGTSRTSMYEAVKRGDVPTVRINGRIYVPTRPLLELFGQTPEEFFSKYPANIA